MPSLYRPTTVTTVAPAARLTPWLLSRSPPQRWNTNFDNLAVVTSPAPDFRSLHRPVLSSVMQGSPSTYTATVGALNGFAGAVTLSVTGLPTGATGTFNPASVTGSGSSTLNITTSSTTPAGSYTLTLTGTSGSLSHSATVTFVVTHRFPISPCLRRPVLVLSCRAAPLPTPPPSAL